MVSPSCLSHYNITTIFSTNRFREGFTLCLLWGGEGLGGGRVVSHSNAPAAIKVEHFEKKNQKTFFWGGGVICCCCCWGVSVPQNGPAGKPVSTIDYKF